MQDLHAATFGNQVHTDPLWDVGQEQAGTYRSPNHHPSPWVHGRAHGGVCEPASSAAAHMEGWKEAILICKAAADPCSLLCPHFALGEQPTCRNPLQLAQRPWT